MENCCLCGWKGEGFLPFNGLENRLCPKCHSLERQRAIAQYLEPADIKGAKVLEVAPLTRLIFGTFLKEMKAVYVSMDRWMQGNPLDPRVVSFVDVLMDLRMLGFADQSFDLVIVQHVLCQIKEDDACIQEIYRVLKSSGVALIEFPCVPGKEITEEFDDPGAMGSYRFYGRDAIQKLDRQGFSMDEINYGLGSFFVCRKRN